MPIISAEPIEANIYRLSLMICNGMVENLVVSPDGLYSVYYIKDGNALNRTGKILNVVQNRACPSQSYILFDWSGDVAARRERIHFYQVQTIKDITPNDAYQIALKHGFVGTVEDWLESLRGDPGMSAYELAVNAGYQGTLEEWLESLKGERGPDGKSAYDIAVEHGFEGSLEDWLAQNGDVTLLKQELSSVKKHISWQNDMTHPEDPTA